MTLQAPTPLEQFTKLDHTSWVLDKVHSELRFSAKHLGLVPVSGVIEDWAASFIVNTMDPTLGSLGVTFNLDSLNTGNEDRDDHIRQMVTAEDPIGVFSVGSLDLSHMGESLAGDLSFNGHDSEVMVAGTFQGTAMGPDSKLRLGYTGSGYISREVFGIGPDLPDFVVSDLVAIKFAIELMPE